MAAGWAQQAEILWRQVNSDDMSPEATVICVDPTNLPHIAGEYEVVLVAGSDGRLSADIRPLVRVSWNLLRLPSENGGCASMLGTSTATRAASATGAAPTMAPTSDRRARTEGKLMRPSLSRSHSKGRASAYPATLANCAVSCADFWER